MSAHVVSGEMARIVELRTSAGQAGDASMVATCDRALDGDDSCHEIDATKGGK